MIFTLQEYQGKGNYSPSMILLTIHVETTISFFSKGWMSALVREAFAHSPEGVFTLEATTPESRDQYAHLGFEVRI